LEGEQVAPADVVNSTRLSSAVQGEGIIEKSGTHCYYTYMGLKWRFSFKFERQHSKGFFSFRTHYVRCCGRIV
jgi:hypothetical protein